MSLIEIAVDPKTISGATVSLHPNVEHHTCPKGRKNHRTSVVSSVYGEDNDQVQLVRDLRGCRYWNIKDLVLELK